MLIHHDNILIELFFNENNKLNSNYWKFINRIKKQKYPNIKNYLLNRYSDLSIGSKTILKESLYRILRHIENRIKCPICGNSTSFNPLKETCYNDHCSRSCEMKDKKVMEKHNKSCLEKYGSINNSSKMKQTKLQKYGDENYNNSEKRNNTNLKKYGNICSLQNDNIKEKTYKTNIKKYGNKIAQKNIDIRNKIKNSNINTCRIKYGVDNIMQVEGIYDKVKNTCIQKYGVDNFTKSTQYKENYPNILEKVLKTKRENNTFNTSTPEDQSYELLKEKYQDIIRQYRSEVYPFNCDFYIPSLDLYIECQYGQFHHKRPYLGTEQDLKDIEILKEKANKIHLKTGKNKSRYDVEIETWTIKDVNKRNIAKQNKLNYIEFWNVNGLKKWLISYDNNK